MLYSTEFITAWKVLWYWPYLPSLLHWFNYWIKVQITVVKRLVESAFDQESRGSQKEETLSAMSEDANASMVALGESILMVTFTIGGDDSSIKEIGMPI
jgi:hypothetical protein